MGKGNSVDEVAGIVREVLEAGGSIDIDRLGTFRPVDRGRYEFVPVDAPSIFIAYVQEDAATAEKLYDALFMAGFNPWLDRRNLLPGQNWPRAIEHSIEIADYFVACLSRQSLCKRSVFQAELRYALDCARRLPLDSIFFVPIRLDDCPIPTAIRDQIHHIDLFPDFHLGIRRLVDLLRTKKR